MKILIVFLAVISCTVSLGQCRTFKKDTPVINIDMNQLPTNVQGIYEKLQNFFNEIFSNSIQVFITNPYEKVITGAITYAGAQELPTNHVVYISIKDVSFMGAPPVILSEWIYTNVNTFPIDFRIPIDSRMINPWGRYTLSVSIKENNELKYESNTHTDIIDNNGKLEFKEIIK